MAEDSGFSSKELLIGALLGGTVGSLAALLLAPKSGEELREDLCDKYENLCDKYENVNQVVCKMIGKEKKPKYCSKRLCCGLVAGGLVGVLTALFLARKSGNEFQNDLLETYENISDYMSHGSDQVKNYVSDFSNRKHYPKHRHHIKRK